MKGIFLDIETNGLDPSRHRCFEIAFRIIDLASGKCEDSFNSVIQQDAEVWKSADPESLEVTGFTQKELASGILESQAREKILQIMEKAKIKRGKAVFICHNPSFDRAFFAQIIPVYTQEKLLWPYHWLDFASMYWALNLNNLDSDDTLNTIQLSKNAIASSEGLPEEAMPHRAMNGVDHLLLCYEKVVDWKGSKS